MTGSRRVVDMVRSPPSPSARSGHIALTGLRLLAGLIWLYNVVWKVPPDFGERRRDGLYHFTHLAIDHPVFKPFSWLVEHVVLPNFTPFGWAVLVVESALAVLLLTGTAVRLAALLGMAQSIAIGLSVAEAPGEWPWAYAMLIGIHTVLLFTPSAQYAAVDAVHYRSTASARRLLIGWGVGLGVIGSVAVWFSLHDDHSVVNVGVRDLEFSLGDYNLRGALTLAAVALAMLAAAMLGWRAAGLSVAAVSLAAAVSIYVQFGCADVWLGGTSTTAVVFVCAAVVGLVTGVRIRRSESS